MHKDWIIVWGDTSTELKALERYIRINNVRFSQGDGTWVVDEELPALYYSAGGPLFMKGIEVWDYPIKKLLKKNDRIRVRVGLLNGTETVTSVHGSESPGDQLISDLSIRLTENGGATRKQAPRSAAGQPVSDHQNGQIGLNGEKPATDNEADISNRDDDLETGLDAGDLQIGLNGEKPGTDNEADTSSRNDDLQAELDVVIDPNDPDTALHYHTRGKAYAKKKEYELALEYYEQSLDVRRIKWPDHPILAQLYTDIAEAHDALEEYDLGLKSLEQALDIQIKQPDPDYPALAESYVKIGKRHDNNGDYKVALENYEKALDTQLQQLGSGHPDVIQSYNRISKVLHNISEYTRALEFYLKVLADKVKKHGEDHPKVADCYRSAGKGFFRTGEYEKGLGYLRKSLDIKLKKYGEDHVEVAQIHSDIGMGQAFKGSYSQALENHQEALDIWAHQKGQEHIEVANCFNHIGKVYGLKGEYAQALEFLQKSLDIRLKKLGPNNRLVGRSYSNIGKIHDENGDHAQALEHHQKALEIEIQRLGPELGQEHVLVARIYNDIGRVYNNNGDYDQALEYFGKAFHIQKQNLYPDHPDVAASHNDIGKTYQKKGDLSSALQAYHEALRIQLKVLGENHPSAVTSYNNIGLAHLEKREFNKALKNLEQALHLGLSIFGESHLDVAVSHDAIGEVNRAKGDYDLAMENHRKALNIRLNKLGDNHSNVAVSYNNIAMAQLGLRDATGALDSARKARAIQENRLEYMLSFTTERGRLAYRSTQRPYNLIGTLGSGPDLAKAVLRNKGIILASLMEDQLMARRSKDLEVKDLYDQLNSAKQVLHNSEQAFLRNVYITDAQMQEARDKVEILHSKLARKINDERKSIGKARRALSITPEKIQKRLLKDQALLEFVRYSHYMQEDQWQERYGVVIITKEGQPLWESLGSAKDIELLVDECLEHMHPGAGREEDDSLEPILHDLYSKLLDPVVDRLPAEINSLIFSPDGGLNFVSFAMLLTDKDQFLCEEYQIKYVSSGRDLMPGSGSVGSDNGKVVVFANPDESLPGTEIEAENLEQRAPDWNLQPEIYLREEATEEKFISVESPHVLHVTTHGWVPEQIAPMMSWAKSETNPLHENLLVFAPQDIDEDSLSYENDGILTAAEASLMELKGTRIMMLAACLTGRGHLTEGEGVMGLRRAFSQAGVQNLVITLWVTWDNSSPIFVEKFYDEAMKRGNASKLSPKALWTTQRDLMVEYRKNGKSGSGECSPEDATLWACRHYGAYVLNHN